jgi:hypothetical protein
MNFKNIKIDSVLHENLKSFCKDKGVFIQEWIENIISEKIKNKDKTMFSKTINEFDFIAIQQIAENLNSVSYFSPSFETTEIPYHLENDVTYSGSMSMHMNKIELDLKIETFENEELFRSKISEYILDLVKQAPSDFEDLIYLEPKNDDSIKKIIYKIISSCNNIALKSRLGPANYIFMNPEIYNIMIDLNNRNILGFTTEKLNSDKKYSFFITNSVLANMKVVVDSSLSLFDIYICRFSSDVISSGLKLFYNYLGCNYDEINYSLSHIKDYEKNFFTKIKFEYLDRSKNDIEYTHNLLKNSFFDVEFSTDKNFKVDIFSSDLNTFNIHDNFNHDKIKKYFLAEQFSTFRSFLLEHIKLMDEHNYDVSHIKTIKEINLYIDGILSVFTEGDQTDFYIIVNGYISSKLFNDHPNFIKNYNNSNLISNVSVPYHTGVYMFENKNIHIYFDPFMKYNDHRIILMDKKIKAKIYKESHPDDETYANYMTLNENKATYHSGINYDMYVKGCKVLNFENLNI